MLYRAKSGHTGEVITPWHGAAGPDGPVPQLFGRDASVARVVDTATSPDAASLILVTGPNGIGRSAVLTAVRDELAARGLTTLTLRVARNEHGRPYSVAARLSAELAVLNRNGAPGRTARAAAPAPRPDAGRQLAAELRAAVTACDKLVVLIDDAQWTDPGSRAVLLPVLRTPAGGRVTFVCALRPSPADPEADRVALDRLRAAGVAEVVTLRPLRESEVRALVARQLQAKPSSSLLSTLRRECRGRPAAVLAAVAGYRRSGALCVFDRHAYLTSPERPPSLPAGLPPVEDLRQLGGRVWPVAKAVAVLHPLGPAATGLIAEAVEADEDTVREALAELCAEGVLRQGPEPGRWRFRVPLLASGLTTRLGPYERRRLAQLAVTAIWAGDATADGRYLAEQLVTAGPFVDSRRASGELLAAGSAAMLEDGYFAERWLRAAIGLITEPERRAQALLAHAAACCIHLRHADALDSAWTVLSEHAGLVTPEALLEMEMIYVVSLGGTFDRAALTEICDGGWRSLPGGEGHRILTRAVALCHLDRWREAYEHLAAQRDVWSRDNDTVAALGLLFSDCIAAFLGRPESFYRAVATPYRWPLWTQASRHRFEHLSQLARTLMAFGELDRAERMLAAHELPSGYRPVPDRVVADSQSGRWDPALDLARLGLATGLSVGDLPTHTQLCRETSVILGARGQLARAREVIERARTVQPVMLHLLAVPEWCLDQALGATERSERVIADALALAVERGLIVGTEELWLMQAVSELAAGDQTAAQRCVDEVSRVAGLLGTGRARMCHLLARAVVHRDHAAADEAVRLVRRRAQPLEQADTMSMVVRHGLADPSLLHEAYALYGDLDALLRRAQLRPLMREHKLTMERQSLTTAENERLLATLVAEGLTNRELAVVLGGSEKSVESRLGRLFKRTGYRSRVELASAMLTGEYPG
ncbi:MULTISPECIES: AAA family ATPase [Streptomyces]|uniref:Helix-turn-helix transcriptional regulator n=1 Tax=Streptomyces xinghaiensis TaxID=1038928 RepID=A0A3M8F7Q1_9ACTN|nr:MULTISPECIES: LuxR family transcriptional regulator [Streptomyces]PQM22909.1 helix-turn-helix transcriptional regulator [Streptomyces xinghaiensis]RKM97384.1 helix-turn-helix transcriptional regulator [Streptomyces xinghaiensis]RNC73782.1 helix-turn-helix transcriptional regulator [Streptomyces xinghaiensis]